MLQIVNFLKSFWNKKNFQIQKVKYLHDFYVAIYEKKND